MKSIGYLITVRDSGSQGTPPCGETKTEMLPDTSDDMSCRIQM